MHAGKNMGIMTSQKKPTAERAGGQGGVAEVQTVLQMGPGRDELTAIERHRPLGHMALAHEEGIVLALRQVEELLAQRAREAQLALGAMKPMEAMEHLEALRRLPHLVAQRLGPGVDLAYFWSRHALRRDQLLP